MPHLKSTAYHIQVTQNKMLPFQAVRFSKQQWFNGFFQGFYFARVQTDPCQNVFHSVQLCRINLLLLQPEHSVQVSHSAQVNSLWSDAEVTLWTDDTPGIKSALSFLTVIKKRKIQPQKHKLWLQTAGRKVNGSVMNCEIFLPLPCNIKTHQQNDRGNGEKWIAYFHLEPAECLRSFS